MLSKASGGLTRRINILVDKALLAGYAENVLGSGELDANTAPVITAHHIWAAIRDSDYISSSLHSLFSPLRVASAGVVVAVLAIAIVLWPEAGSIASQSQALDQVSGKILDRRAPRSPVTQTLVEEQQEPVQKPQFTPVPTEREISPLDVTESEAAAIDEEFSATDSESVADEKIAAMPKRTLRLEPSLVEGFVQPSWMTDIAARPGEQSLAAAGFGAAANRSQLQSRVLASIDWLRNSEGVGYTVQFLSGETSNLGFAESFLRVLDDHNLIAQSYVCMSTDGSRSYWTVKYGNFEGLSLAQDFIDGLPAKIHEYKPFVQNMSSVECNTNNSIAALILE